MGTRTQVQVEANNQPQCVHEQDCEAAYRRQYQRVQALCGWIMPTATQAQQLALAVFADTWRQPGAWPALNPDRLTERLAVYFRFLFQSELNRPAWLNLSPAGLPAWQEGQASLWQAMQALPMRERLLYLLYEREGYTIARLSAWLQLEPQTCAATVHRARVQLRRNLQADRQAA